MSIIVGFGASIGIASAHVGLSLSVRSGLKKFHKFGMAGLPQTELDRTIEHRWEPVKRLGRRPAMQFLGPGEEHVTIKGFIYPPDYGSFESLQAMRNESMLGFPRPFITGYGEYQGLWCIKKIKDVQTHYWPDGSPRKVEFTIDLTHYGSDLPGLGVVGGLFQGAAGLGSIVGALTGGLTASIGIGGLNASISVSGSGVSAGVSVG